MPDRIVSRGPGLAKVVERQMRNWELAHTQAQADHPLPVSQPGYEVADFITLANDVGGGGAEIANLLAEKLNWPLFDREILTTMADDDHVRTRLYQAMDERDMSWFEETLRHFLHGPGHKNDYFHRLTETLLCLARQSTAIFIGRASDLILPKSKGLRVKFICSVERRIKNFAEKTGTSQKEAAKQIDRINRERAAFIAKNFKMDVNEPTRFDLLVNTERFSVSEAVQIILEACRIRDIPV